MKPPPLPCKRKKLWLLLLPGWSVPAPLIWATALADAHRPIPLALFGLAVVWMVTCAVCGTIFKAKSRMDWGPFYALSLAPMMLVWISFVFFRALLG